MANKKNRNRNKIRLRQNENANATKAGAASASRPQTPPVQKSRGTSKPKGRPTVSKKERAIAAQHQRAKKKALQTYIVIGIGVLAVVAVGVWAILGQESLTGVSDPEAFDLPSYEDGERIRLEDFEGKPVVVNFFASWCTACDQELPHFSALSEAFQDEVIFIGVNSLETGNRDLMPDRHDIDWWPLAKDIGGDDNGLHGDLGLGRGLPHTAFYDAEGNLLATEGFLNEPALRARLRGFYDLDV